MGFLRTLFWIAVTVVVVVFSFHNWVPVTVSLFGDLKADVKLPVLLLIAFLAGFLPLLIWHKAMRWRDQRRSPAAVPLSIEPVPPAIYNPVDTTAEPGITPARAD
ncbi:hypothetical protein [Sphingomonas nostoxanthinifaciens]|uniref:hypothetical protein n=1 Tax=Sphingomonas nostoxanthinifaciens TaxID=2872652 RepID=UPI001CC21609|nr:hypothetical protein [Sphingomonas nostoxanthinifaciens]UAK23019.1 hypothetical protein K8P63_11320 [Sphingomonas nostoxanthinifaciens]